MDYRYIKLGDCLSLITNGFVVKQSRDTDKAGGYPFTRIETLSNGRFNRDRMGYADIYDLKGLESYVLEDEDIIISHINSRRFLGRSVLYKKIGDEIILHGMNVLRIKTNRDVLNPVYANYFFQTEYYKQCIDNIRKDAINQSSFSIGDFQKLVIPLPEIEYQEKIADVLSSLDRKIALNRVINRNLEALAKQLYDYWFVQFDFPDENGRPYKSSGGKMVWNEKLKQEIPIGWGVKTVYDIAEVYNGATPSTTDEQNYGGDVIWITPKDLSNQQQKFVYQGERNISKDGYDSCSTHLLPQNTILMSSRAPIGLLAIAKAELCTNQGFKSFVPKNANASTYLYYYIQTHIKQIEQLGTGTTFKEVSRDDILKFLILKPSDEILVLWETMIVAVNDKQLEIQKENENLTKQRDELLPLLMNGQVSVNSDL